MAGYGLTHYETSPVVTTAHQKRDALRVRRVERRRRRGDDRLAHSRHLFGVVDAEMRDVPRDARSMGEVVIMGDQVMDGYFREPEATKAVMSGAPGGPPVWLHTGDMAVWDEDELYRHRRPPQGNRHWLRAAKTFLRGFRSGEGHLRASRGSSSAPSVRRSRRQVGAKCPRRLS